MKDLVHQSQTSAKPQNVMGKAIIFASDNHVTNNQKNEHMKMKTLLLVTIATLGLTAETMAQNLPNYVPANGLVGWWPFNGNANDESGNGNNGTANGAILTSDRFGNNNKAYRLDGVNDHIEVPDNNSLDINGNITLSVWINPESIGDYRIIDKVTVNFGGAYGIDFSGITANTIDRLRYLNGGEQSLPFGLDTNQNFHIVVTYDQINFKYYINGQLNNSIPKTGLANNNNNPLRFGANSLLNDNWFHGKLDDIGIWNRALTQQEISDLYNGNICYQTITITDTLLINMGIVTYNPITYNNTIKIFPNPTNDHITIDFGNYTLLNGHQIIIENSLGQQMFQTDINQQSSYISLSSWTGNGLYFVHIIDAQGNTIDIRKIVLQ